MSRKLWRCGADGKLEAGTAPIKPLSEGYVRVIPKCVAFNPTDYKHLTNKLAVGAGAGCDFAGVITEIGPGVKGFHVGQTVAGGQTGSNLSRPDDGVYTNLIDTRADSLFVFHSKLVHNYADRLTSGPVYSFEQASSLGVSLGTVALATCWYNKTPLERNSQRGWCLVYGAASSLGFVACQVYKYMGYSVIAVASAKHRQMFSSAGIEHLLDYHNEEWPQQARAISDDAIVLAYDTISSGGTLTKVYEAVSTNLKSKIHTSLPIHPKKLPESTKPADIDTPLWYLLWNKSWPMGPWFKENVASDEQLEMTSETFAQINRFLATNQLKALPVHVFGTGYDRIPSAMKRFGEGVSGYKIVVRYQNANSNL